MPYGNKKKEANEKRVPIIIERQAKVAGFHV